VLRLVVLAGRAVDRVGKGIRGAPRNALLMVDADPTARGRIFGFHRAADTAGAVVGPALGLYELLNHQIRPLLAIAVIPAILSVLLIRAVHEDSRPTPTGHSQGRHTQTGRAPDRQAGGSAAPAAFAYRHPRGVRAGQLPRRPTAAAGQPARALPRRGRGCPATRFRSTPCDCLSR